MLVHKLKMFRSNGMYWYWFLFAACIASLFLVDVFQFRYHAVSRLKMPTHDPSKGVSRGFLIRTPGCCIPYMDPFDPALQSFLKPEKTTICNKGLPPLVDSNLTAIFLVNSSKAKYTKTSTNLSCCYQPFQRKEPTDHEIDDKVNFEEKCTKFKESAIISHEFIRVTCTSDNQTVYKDFFSFVPTGGLKSPPKSNPPLNVLIVGIDAVSRLNFYRQMPQTLKYLRKIAAVELLGYNKVGDNTFPNLIPVLTGLSEKELGRKCWRRIADHFDKCPFIWRDYKEKGFVTSFGEDSSWMGIFNYMKLGFQKQPTDFMWGFFNRIAEKQIGNSRNMNVNECIGPREVYKLFLDHIRRFVSTMDAQAAHYFAFYWGASLSHDYLNKPQQGDSTYRDFFHNLSKNGNLNNTVLVVMSDHGIRWGAIRQTYQGRMEERLPFVFIALPQWYRSQFPDVSSSLTKNAKLLTTPYDLHETLKDLLNPYNITWESGISRGHSLFSEISPNRTCLDAGIAKHWCTCQQSLEIPQNATAVVDSANFVVNYINRQLVGYAQCAKLRLVQVVNARMMIQSKKILKDYKVKDYMVTLRTSPGDAMFEASVRSTKGTNKTYQYEVLGTISRLNLYGRQSVCITDFHLKLYCYCSSLL